MKKTPFRRLKPRVAITLGDPRGIGPEVVLKALAGPALWRACRPLVLGDVNLLRRTAQRLGMNLPIRPAEEEMGKGEAVLPVLPLSDFPPLDPVEVPPEEGARASFAYIAAAGKMALEGKVAAIATAPVSKEAICRAGIPFQGHTEYLAGISGTKEFVMMLAGKRLRVALVTTHLPLREVPGRLEAGRILSVIEITSRGLADYFRRSAPRLAVTGLNPHAGEGGLFGGEEQVIRQAVEAAREKGISVRGPLAADSLFYYAQKGDYDAVVCMYHDQGLIPLKLLHFDSAVNVTLGLPFIRTSVDHGVAFDLAGRGLANSRSMEEAVLLAARMADRKGELRRSA